MKLRLSLRRRRQSGAAVIEVGMISLVMVPLLLGTTGYGLNMVRALSVIQLSRDAGHMFARGADFTQPGNKTILISLAKGLGMTTSGAEGKAVVILSSLVYIDKAMCAADGKVDGSGEPLGCTNYMHWAFTKRITIGDAAMRISNFGSPL